MYQFNPSLTAKTTMKERFVFMLFMGILFFLLYGASNYYAGLTAPHPSWYMDWEKKIPFIPSFIVPYMSSDLMFVIAFLLPYTRLELRVLALRVLFIILLSVIVFVLFPLSFSFEKPQTTQFTLLFGLLSADLPFNQLPSLHISFAIVLWASMRSHINNQWLKYFTALWFWLIALSTLFVYQHHFIDIPTGAMVGVLGLYFIHSKNTLAQQFTTPRSLKMGLYYLMASSIFMLFSFQLSLFFLYPFLSLFLVSVIYAFGLNSYFSSTHKINRIFLYLLFAPYILGNHLSWLYYKRKLPLMSQVNKKIYFGRVYDKNELKIMKEKKLQHIISLAIEHPKVQNHPFHSFYILPFLDQTIPSPKLLHEAVLLIEKHKEQGVYVHCALGLSRSVLVVSAWLLYIGSSRDEIHKLMKRVRPAYVKSAYMEITLDIYEAYLISN